MDLEITKSGRDLSFSEGFKLFSFLQFLLRQTPVCFRPFQWIFQQLIAQMRKALKYFRAHSRTLSGGVHIPMSVKWPILNKVRVRRDGMDWNSFLAKFNELGHQPHLDFCFRNAGKNFRVNVWNIFCVCSDHKVYSRNQFTRSHRRRRNLRQRALRQTQLRHLHIEMPGTNPVRLRPLRRDTQLRLTPRTGEHPALGKELPSLHAMPPWKKSPGASSVDAEEAHAARFTMPVSPRQSATSWRLLSFTGVFL